MNSQIKLAMSLDYLYGKNVSKFLPTKDLIFKISSKTEKIKSVYFNNKSFVSFRSDGNIILSLYAANFFIKSKEFRENCITVTHDAAAFVKVGKSVFSKHVIKCGNNIYPGSEVIVMNTMNKVIAIGKAILSKKMIKDFKFGVAVKIRNGVN